MGIEDLFIWYQKKIGRYDKQKWDTIEQRMLYCVQTKTSKSNNDFIDLDLVRGSFSLHSKPKQGFIAIARTAIFKSFLLPFYWKWWIQQTSLKIYLLLTGLYFSQLVNLIVCYRNGSAETNTDTTYMEVVVPCVMMWVLCLIHTRISATGLECTKKKIKMSRMRNYTKKSNGTRRTSTDTLIDTKCQNRAGRSSNENVDIRNKKIVFSDDGDSRLRNRTTQRSDLNFNPQISEMPIIDIGPHLESSTPDIIQYLNINENSLNYASDSRNSSELESDTEVPTKEKKNNKKRKCHIPRINITPTVDSTCDTDEEYDGFACRKNEEASELTTSTNEWLGVTTNSEDCTYSSDLDQVSDDHGRDFEQTAGFNPSPLKAWCIIWEKNEIKVAELSMLEISSAIIRKVESIPKTMDYFYFGLVISIILALIPILFRLCNYVAEPNVSTDNQYSIFELFLTLLDKLPETWNIFIDAALGTTLYERLYTFSSCFQRFVLACLLFLLLAITENTFKQRFLYAKFFSHLTTFQRSRQFQLPHFRLNKVRNIKTWLAVRYYLILRGPHRFVDIIVSTAFIINLLLLAFLCVEILKENGALHSQYHVEALIWCLSLGIFHLRFMTLGIKINKKYRNLSVLITEQINLHLQIEQKQHNKEELTIANNVLKLAIDLIKELPSPFKISGLSPNSILYNITKLIILSALSGVLSEILGFKLKLHKIKIK